MFFFSEGRVRLMGDGCLEYDAQSITASRDSRPIPRRAQFSRGGALGRDDEASQRESPME